MQRTLLFGWLLLAAALRGQAQLPLGIDPINEWLGAQENPLDPSGGPLIVRDFGRFTLETPGRSTLPTYEYQRIIKVFEQIPPELGQMELLLRPGEELDWLRAATHQLNPGGKAVAFKVQRRALTEERLPDGSTRLRFEFPFLKPGAVLECSYAVKARSRSGLRDWVFQQAYPVLISRFEVLLPDRQSIRPLLSDPAGEVRFSEDLLALQPSLREVGSDLMALPNGPMSGRVQFQRLFVYEMEQVKALPQERFAPDPAVSSPGVSILSPFDAPASLVNGGLFESWEKLQRFMLRRLQPSRTEQALLASFAPLGPQPDPSVLAASVYAALRARWRWDGQHSLLPGNLARLEEQGQGSSADLNFALLHLLREAGLQAHPVLISTRGHGLAQAQHPYLLQFNHFVVMVQLPRSELLLDATGLEEEPFLLPVADLNGSGLLLMPDEIRWVSLNTQNKIVRLAYNRFEFEPGGRLRGSVILENDAYGAVLERARLESEGSLRAYLEKYVLTNLGQADIHSDTLAESEDEFSASLMVGCTLSTDAFFEQKGDLILLEPMTTRALLENPFPDTLRQTPVDFDYPLREAYMLGLRVPAGYEVAQVPEPKRVLMPGNAGVFHYNILVISDIIYLTTAIYLNKTLYAPEEYGSLRTFFDLIVEKHQEKIVFRKMM